MNPVLFAFAFIFTLTPAFAAPPDLVELREGVRKMASTENCAQCHMPGQPGALQRILDVYNLKNTHWSASLSDERLVSFQGRMQDAIKDKSKLKLIEKFVAAELAYRKSSPDEREQDIEQNKRERALNELGILPAPPTLHSR